MSTVRIQVRRGTGADWSSVNPVLAAGEIGFETNTKKIKVGDGSTTWNSLGYIASDAPAIGEIAMDSIASALSMGSGLSKSYDDNADTITINNTGVLSFNTRTGEIDLRSADIVDALGYPPVDPTTLTNIVDNLSQNISDGIQTSEAYAKAYADGLAINYDPVGSAATVQGIVITYVDQEIGDAIVLEQAYTDQKTQIAYDNSKSYTDSKISTEVTNRNNAVTSALSEAKGYTDSEISTEVTNRNSAISTEVNNRNAAIATAKSEAITTSENYTDAAITQEVSDRNAAIATAKSQAIATSENYTDAAISSLGGQTTSDITDAITTAELYTDAAITQEVSDRNTAISTAITQEVSDRNAAIATAKSQAISTAEGYTDNQISNLVNASPATLDTLKELADAIGDDPNFAVTVANSVATAESNSNSYTDAAITQEVSDRNAAIATAKSQAISTANSYTDSEITQEVSDRNAAIATAKSQAITTSENYADTKKAEAITESEAYTDSLINSEISNRTSAINSAISSEVTNRNSAISNAISQEVVNRDSAIQTSLDTAEQYTDTHANLTQAHGATGAVVGTTNAQTLTNKTLVTPTIASFTNATHDHTNASGGGILTSAAISDFTEASQDVLGSTIIAGSGISVNYNDLTDNLTVANTGVLSISGTSNQISTSGSTGSITLSLPNNVTLPGNLEVSGDTIIDGNLQVKGTTTTINTINYSVEDNLIYLNAALKLDIQSATHNTNTVTYRFADTPPIVAGMNIRITGATPSDYNIAAGDNVVVDSVSSTSGHTDVTVTKTVTVAYVSGGSAEFKINSDPDLGFAGGYYENGYAHAGLFRDASDNGTFKFFQGYTPEPDDSVNIDTTHASFALAPLKASTVTATTFAGNLTGNVTGNVAGNLTGNVTGNVSGNAGTVTNGVYTTDNGTVTNTMLAGSIANNKLSNSSLTIGSTSISLGATATTIAGLTLTSPIIATITNTGTLTLPSSTDTLVGRATTDTLTNKSISGSTNTLSNIPNSALTNNSVTVGSTSIALGQSSTTLSGLTSVSSTGFTGALTGNADTATKLATARNINGTAFDGSASITIKASTTNPLTIGTGLSGTSFDGSGAVTIAIDSTVATLTGTQTLTNKTLTSPTISTILNTGTLTLPTSTDTLVGKATTDTFTNKTFDTAGNGNVFKINGTSISAVTGSGSVVLATSPVITGLSADTITTSGNVTVGGNLVVNGTTTTVNSTTLAVADNNIEIAKVATPTDVTANGAGITIKGATDKTINWYSSTSSFTSSENLDILSGKTYKIAGTDVLTSTQVLGKTLPSGTVVGTTDTQTLTGKTISGASNTISNIGNSSLTNSTISGVSLGSNLNALTIGTGLSGTSYNGSSAVTIAVDSTVATLSGTQTLTNKTINGSNNTITNVSLTSAVTGTLPIANGGTGATTASTAAAALLPTQTGNSGKYLTTDGSGTLSWGTVSGYSAPTIGSTSIGSGATVTTIAGLTLTAPYVNAGVNTYTASQSSVASDAAAFVQMNVASANTYTITGTYATGASITITQIGAGQTTITGTGVVSAGATSNSPKLRTQYSSATAYYNGTNWIVIGDIV